MLGAVGLDMLRCPRDRGRLLYRERRVSRGRPFELLKFRTLREDVLVEADGHVRPYEADHSNLTWAGRRVLKPMYLDELPQLWNVVRGEMSLIGPRPTLAYQVEQYSQRQRKRLDVLPGITGWAQIQGRASLPWEERIELDVWYVEHRSPLVDLKILLRTPLALLGGHYKGATGGWRSP